ncbi:MAG: hypothetical protein KBI18_08295 [Brachymonas sp.]|nr:hypothetical protein [Brachymonas sp.]
MHSFIMACYEATHNAATKTIKNEESTKKCGKQAIYTVASKTQKQESQHCLLHFLHSVGRQRYADDITPKCTTKQ